jgi:hypothetical protein
VRAQLERDYPASELTRRCRCTRPALSVQTLAEQSMTKTLDALGKRQPELQGDGRPARAMARCRH